LTSDQEPSVSRIKQVIDALEAERAEVRERLDWLDEQIEVFREDQADADAPAKTPSRSKRRATATRASRRRATARSLKPDLNAKILSYLKDHPESTAGDVAKGLNLARNSTASKLTQMVKMGEIKKARRGYAVD
jgi:predicted HTH transcriptional regulator